MSKKILEVFICALIAVAVAILAAVLVLPKTFANLYGPPSPKVRQRLEQLEKEEREYKRNSRANHTIQEEKQSN